MSKKLREISEARRYAKGREINGRNYLVLHRKAADKPSYTCPFCGEKHTHGAHDGHVNAHCSTTDYEYVLGKNVAFKNEGGQIFHQCDGYLIETLS